MQTLTMLVIGWSTVAAVSYVLVVITFLGTTLLKPKPKGHIVTILEGGEFV